LKGFVTIKWQVVDFFKDLFISHAESSQLQGHVFDFSLDYFYKSVFFLQNKFNQRKLPNKAIALEMGHPD